MVLEPLICTDVNTENPRLEGALGDLGTDLCAGEDGQLSPGGGGQELHGKNANQRI